MSGKTFQFATLENVCAVVLRLFSKAEAEYVVLQVN